MLTLPCSATVRQPAKVISQHKLAPKENTDMGKTFFIYMFFFFFFLKVIVLELPFYILYRVIESDLKSKGCGFESQYQQRLYVGGSE